MHAAGMQQYEADLAAYLRANGPTLASALGFKVGPCERCHINSRYSPALQIEVAPHEG